MIKTALKSFALKLLPDPLLQWMKQIHYARVLAKPVEGEPDLAALHYFVSAGDVVLDIGANIGFYTKELSRLVGTSGQVFGLEPVPLTFQFLESNVEKLGLSNVRVINSAASDHPGTLQMEVPLYPTGSGEDFYSARVIARAPGNHLRTFSVPATTLDSLCESPVSFVKCDVEGHELLVVAGARGLITKHRPAWLIEVSKEEVFAVMESYGYKSYWFDGHSLHPRVASGQSINYFFLLEEHVLTARTRGLDVS